MKKSILYSLASLLFICGQSLTAEDIKIPLGQQSPELEKVARPTTGMKKSLVLSQFGEPLKQNPEKGKPPISSWEYTNFVVYFESDYVIHTVLKPKYHESKETVIEQTDEIPESQLKSK